MLHVVLYQPEIPHNTGAVGRLCLATGARLHLIRPFGFSLDDKHLKRAGLDYWADVSVKEWDSFESLREEALPDSSFYYLTTKASLIYWDENFAASPDCYLIFGPETRGLPASMITDPGNRALRIPMEGTRSLNLATSVGIVLYEAVRQMSCLTGAETRPSSTVK
jgi:tRNA (cytidine/uridine-2'-O-)-methyltransferase